MGNGDITVNGKRYIRLQCGILGGVLFVVASVLWFIWRVEDHMDTPHWFREDQCRWVLQFQANLNDDMIKSKIPAVKMGEDSRDDN